MKEGSWVHDKLFEYAEEKLKGLNLDGVVSKEEAVALISYTGQLYGQVNPSLIAMAREARASRNAFAMGRGTDWTRSTRVARLIDAALAKFPAYKGTTYRNIQIRPADLASFLKDYKTGQTVVWPALSSTSKSASVFSGNANVRFVINGRSGRSVEELSSHRSEREVLFATNSRFVVREIEKQSGMTVIYLDDVTPGIDFDKI
jgi:hypothetical protein